MDKELKIIINKCKEAYNAMSPIDFSTFIINHEGEGCLTEHEYDYLDDYFVSIGESRQRVHYLLSKMFRETNVTTHIL